MRLCRFGSDSFSQDFARLTERRKKKEERKKKEDEQFAWAAILVYRLETSVSLAKGIFKLRNIA